MKKISEKFYLKFFLLHRFFFHNFDIQLGHLPPLCPANPSTNPSTNRPSRRLMEKFNNMKRTQGDGVSACLVCNTYFGFMKAKPFRCNLCQKVQPFGNR